MPQKMVAINYQNQFHHLDHVAVIAYIMQIPLKTRTLLCETVAKHYYPGVQAFHFDSSMENLAFLGTCDVIFDTLSWTAETHKTLGDTFQNKKMKHVHFPHGFSDKFYWFKHCLEQDYLMLYGQNMLNMFEENNLLGKLPPYVLTGNYRYQYYLDNKAFLDELVDREVFSKFEHPAPIVLYAPSYNDLEAKSSFFEAIEMMLDRLPKQYNILIKLHLGLMDKSEERILLQRIMARYTDRKNVLWLNVFPLVYPILNKVDICISDSSSIVYDFLAFNRPIFLLKQEELSPTMDRGQRFNLGTVIRPENYARIWEIIEDTLPTDFDKFGSVRKETYQLTFGESKPFEVIRDEVLKMLK